MFGMNMRSRMNGRRIPHNDTNMKEEVYKTKHKRTDK